MFPKKMKLIIADGCHLLLYAQKNLELSITLEPENEVLLRKTE